MSFLVQEVWLMLAQLGWGLWLPLAVTQLGNWGQEWAGASEMLALTHEAHVTILTFGQLHFPDTSDGHCWVQP